MIKENNKLKNTLELIKLMHETLTDVIQFLDEKKYSNTKIREKVDMILNHSKLANKVEKEIEKVSCYPIFVGCEKPTTSTQIRDLLNKYKGLTINCSDLSRAKFIRIVIKGVERDVEYSTKTTN